MIQKYFWHFMGFIILTFGVVGIIFARLGASPVDAFNYFMYVITPLSLGTVAVLTGFFIAILSFIFNPKKDILISVLFLVMLGVLIDLWKFGFELLPEELLLSYLMRIPLSVISLISIAFGTAITLTTGITVSPYDRLMMVIHHKIHSMQFSKMIIEGSFFILAIILGFITKLLFTQVNIMTIIMVLLNGPLVQYFVKLIVDRKKKGVAEYATQ